MRSLRPGVCAPPSQLFLRITASRYLPAWPAVERKKLATVRHRSVTVIRPHRSIRPKNYCDKYLVILFLAPTPTALPRRCHHLVFRRRPTTPASPTTRSCSYPSCSRSPWPRVSTACSSSRAIGGAVAGSADEAAAMTLPARTAAA